MVGTLSSCTVSSICNTCAFCVTWTCWLHHPRILSGFDGLENDAISQNYSALPNKCCKLQISLPRELLNKNAGSGIDVPCRSNWIKK